jgi:glycopeptide antibiotics resistance protein
MQKKIINTLLVLFTLFIIYNTLLPFKFNTDPAFIQYRLDSVSLIPYHNLERKISLTDLAGNIILFVPFGFLLYMNLMYQKRKHAIIITVITGAFLSLSIEVSQIFIEHRNAAAHDLFNNTIGSLLGAVIASIYSNKISAHGKKIFYELFRTKPFFLLLVIILALQGVAAVMPFTVSITISFLKKSIKSANFIPFDYQSVGKLYFDSPDSSDFTPFDYTKFSEDVLFWMAIGCLIMLCYQYYWRGDNRIKFLIVILPPVYFKILEFAQLFIVSRTTDINDIISGSLGIYLGYFLFVLINRRSSETFNKESINNLKIPLILYSIFILYSGLRPFDWTLSQAVISKSLNLENLIPFFTYFRKQSLWNIFDLVNSIIYIVPISLYLSFKMRENSIIFPVIYIKMTLLGLLIGGLIELTQVFSITRVAEITDVLSYGLGGWSGTFLIFYYEREIKTRLNSTDVHTSLSVEKKLV